jgi:cytochrome c oxidase subunit IV
MNHMPDAPPVAAAHPATAPLPVAGHPTHPIGVYLKVWGLLFVLSALSYSVDYFGAHGFLRWFLIVAFMLLKAGLIVAIFMHMAWERMALIYAILVPPLALLTLVWLMTIESHYTFRTLILFFVGGG